jgi:hypothetical protein
MSSNQSKLFKFLSSLEKEKVQILELKISRENWWSEIKNHKVLVRSEILRNLISHSVACFITNSSPKTTSTHKISERDFNKLINFIPHVEFENQILKFNRDSKTFLCLEQVETPQQVSAN